MSQNFHEKIKKLEKKLSDSNDSMYSYNVKYRDLQDKIDKLNKTVFNTKGKLREVVSTINEILTKLHLTINNINMDDLKTLNNIKVITLINNAVRLINFKL